MLKQAETGLLLWAFRLICFLIDMPSPFQLMSPNFFFYVTFFTLFSPESSYPFSLCGFCYIYIIRPLCIKILLFCAFEFLSPYFLFLFCSKYGFL